MIHDIKQSMNQKNAIFSLYLMGLLYSGGEVFKSAKEVDWLKSF